MNKIITTQWLWNALKHKMPMTLRIKIIFHCLFRKNCFEERAKLFHELKKRRRITSQRNRIDWFPSIDSQKCNNCGICFDFCPKNVFCKFPENIIEVNTPYECVLLCSGCILKCPQHAISFPDKKAFRKFIEYR